MVDRLGIAVLGCGYWGVNYVRAFGELPGARVVVVCDQRVDRVQEIGRRFPGVQLATDIADALGHAGVDAVVIATEAASHHAVARRSLLAGKHVLVEKPMATTVADVEDLIDLARTTGMVLMVGHTFLYNPGVRTMKDYVRKGEVGKVHYLYARRTNLGPIRHDVSALWDLAPHDVSIFNYLLDSAPAWVSAVGARVLGNCREDVGFVALGYPDGVLGHVHVSWVDPHKVREVVVVGSEKRVVFNDLQAMEPVRVFEKGAAPLTKGDSSEDQPFVMRDGAVVSPKIEASEPLKNQCSHFLDCVAGGGTPLSGGPEGRDVVRVLDAIDRSVARGGAPVTLA